jgi:hypothetical protein
MGGWNGKAALLEARFDELGSGTESWRFILAGRD